MNANEHGRAMDLLTQRDIEGIAENDAQWLESHLAACRECASFELALNGAEQALRSTTVLASASLVASTQARVRARAEQLRERQSRVFLMAISFAMGVVFSTLSAWVWWKAGGWLVENFGLPSALVTPGLVVFWLLPAIVLGTVAFAFPESKFEGSVIHLLLKNRQRGSQ